MMSFHLMNDRWLKACRRIAMRSGPLGVYAKMALASRNGRGVRLSLGEIEDVLLSDEAVNTALVEAICEEDAGS